MTTILLIACIGMIAGFYSVRSYANGIYFRRIHKAHRQTQVPP